MARKKRKRARGEGAIYSYLTTGRKELRWRVEPIGGGPGGKAGFHTQADALAWWNANRNRPPAADTLGEWLCEWLRTHRPDWKPLTYRRYKFSVDRYLIPKLGHVQLRDLTGQHVKAMLAEMTTLIRVKGQPKEKAESRPAKDAERHKVGSALRNALNAAVAGGLLASNPIGAGRGIKLPGARHPEKPVFTPAEAKALVKAADGLGFGPAYRLWLDAGLRPGELMGLDWEDLDLDRGTVRVRQSWDGLTYTMNDPKTPRSKRTIRLSAATVASLRNICSDKKPTGVFLRPVRRSHVGRPRRRGERYWQSEFWLEFWRPVLVKAELGEKKYGPYSVRHFMATSLLRAGVPVLVVSRRLGHTSAKRTLDVYAHLCDGDDDAAAEVMGWLLTGGQSTGGR